MSRVIHARLDEEAQAVREKLARRLGWNDSQIVREGIKALAGRLLRERKRSIVGLGKYRSGIPDLGSSEKHLADFGK
jgi:hypothetical protein